MVMMIPKKSYSFDNILVTLYLFFLISFLIQTLASPTVHYCRHDQRDFLLEFKHEFPVNDSYSTSYIMSSWNKSSDCCSWEGVDCDENSGKVISLQFYYVFLKNSLKPNSGLFKLQYLQILTLSFCNLNGEIPSSLGNLSSLTFLDLLHNELVGQIPASIGNLTELNYLSFGGNQLTGNVPISFSNLVKLAALYLEDNYLESSVFGPFPTSLLTNPLIRVVKIEGNQFNGSLGFLNTNSSSMISSLHIGQNEFDGPIPEYISKLLNLNGLDLSYNNLIGPIPTSIAQLVNLSYLDLSNNKLEGKVPSCLWRLTVLKLSHNSFSSFGKSSEVVARAQMSVLSLDSNMFREPFPHWICKFRSIDFLDLSDNRFSGSIPQCLRNITNLLGVFNLRNNNFSGILPDIFINATKLCTLDVSRNHLEGELPKSLINCKAMEFINVESNNFNDEFPSWLGSLPSLNVLILRSNQFYGSLYLHHVSISFQKLKVIDVSNNDFTGTFPAFYFSSWQGMTTLHAGIEDTYMIDLMNYNVVYRNSMEMVHKGVDTKFKKIRRDFIAIDFSGNKFYGRIPESIGLLKGLRLLNLSNNAFTSEIPKSLANLTYLEALDLSQNQLTGQIPQDIGALSFLSTMNFSHNNLEGPIPRSTQFGSQNCTSFMGNPKLYGLEEICGKTHVMSPEQRKSEAFPEAEEKVISWIAAAIAYVPGVFCGIVIGHILVSHKHEWFMETFHGIKPRVAI